MSNGQLLIMPRHLTFSSSINQVHASKHHKKHESILHSIKHTKMYTSLYYYIVNFNQLF